MSTAFTNAESENLPTVLLVEDNPDDVLLMRRAFHKAALPASLRTVIDGDQAVDYLSGKAAGDSAELPLRPALVLLDWKLPRRSGLEVLRWIRNRPQLSTMPVVILSSSREDEDIEQAYAAGANSYLQKPVAFETLLQTLHALQLYWLQTNITSSREQTATGPRQHR